MDDTQKLYGLRTDQYKHDDELMISVESALEQTLSLVEPLPAEQVAMIDALGRVVAVDVSSDIDIAPFDNSAMDGYAVRASDLTSANPENPCILEVVGLIGAGQVYEGSLEVGQALRIMTGAPVPRGADTVVKVEDTELCVADTARESPVQANAHHVRFFAAPKPGANVRLHGEEVRAGEVILPKGSVLTPAGVGLLASTGTTAVLVHRRPEVAILATGDELVSPDVVPQPGQIRDSNCYSLAAAVRQAGGTPTVFGEVRDTKAAVIEALKAAVGHDFIILSGGAAEGDFDYTSQVVRELGQLHFNKVRMRPGKAQTLGEIDGTVVFGLPGNPAAALVGFEVLIRPALLKMQGFTKIRRSVTTARLTQEFNKRDARRLYVRACLARDMTSGEYTVTPEKNQSSASFLVMHRSNCLVVLPEGTMTLSRGEMVACMRLDVPEGTL
ncbi:MAG: molybdopterin molybdotransferase MoeA [Coriobacteriales bacterium]|jgi:molybdopterin molybdotransferase|nr:molybdopterin molybdotransferase MoeA [Coriobacteriales bacterium]